MTLQQDCDQHLTPKTSQSTLTKDDSSRFWWVGWQDDERRFKFNIRPVLMDFVTPVEQKSKSPWFGVSLFWNPGLLILCKWKIIWKIISLLKHLLFEKIFIHIKRNTSFRLLPTLTVEIYICWWNNFNVGICVKFRIFPLLRSFFTIPSTAVWFAHLKHFTSQNPTFALVWSSLEHQCS